MVQAVVLFKHSRVAIAVEVSALQALRNTPVLMPRHTGRLELHPPWYPWS